MVGQKESCETIFLLFLPKIFTNVERSMLHEYILHAKSYRYIICSFNLGYIIRSQRKLNATTSKLNNLTKTSKIKHVLTDHRGYKSVLEALSRE